MKPNNFYWAIFAPNIKNLLQVRLGNTYARQAMPKIKQQYHMLMQSFPDIGKHTLTDLVYLACILIAIWLGTDKRFTTKEMQHIFKQVLERLQWLFGMVNLNKPYAINKLRKETENYIEWLKKDGINYPHKWEGHIDTTHEKGFCYVLTRCPVREFCAKNGYLELLPAICSTDYTMYSMMHGVLERQSTLYDGNHCDFWVYGDKQLEKA